MKIRTDFVSNSSSSSYIIAVNHTKYSFNDFLKDIEEESIMKKGFGICETPEFIEEMCNMNRRNLDYHLHSSELLFLGDLVLDANPYNTIYAYGITLSPTQMRYRISYNDPETETDDDKKQRAEHIVKLSKRSLDEYNEISYNTEIFFVSKNTIYNTKALIEHGYRVNLHNWEKDLDKLLERLNNGESIYGIRMCQGGDDHSESTIYYLGGWYAPFNSKGKFEILHSECC